MKLHFMNEKETIRTSKFLSLVLRHVPERVGLKLGDGGWVSVEELLKAVNGHGVTLTLEQLKHAQSRLCLPMLGQWRLAG